MTTEQFEALESWIKALIAESLDDMKSSDGGLISFMEANRRRDEAFKVLTKEEPQ